MAPLQRLIPSIPIVVAAVLCLSNCGLGGGSVTPTAPYLIVTQPRTLAAGQSVTLTVSASNATAFTPNWAVCCPALTPVGTLSAQTANTILYTAPASPPIYASATFAVPQGQVQVQVEDTTGSHTTTDAQIVILSTVAAGISPATVTVGRGQYQQFTGYAVGSVNASVTYQVNNVNGGNSTVGTINAAGLYLAPGLIPPGTTVTVTAIAAADPTKTASATVTIS